MVIKIFNMVSWQDLKAEGDKAFNEKDFAKAETSYTQAIDANPPADQIHLLYSNRSATRISLKYNRNKKYLIDFY